MPKIDLKDLTTCSVEGGGDVIEIGFIDASGEPALLRVPFAHAQSLLMTLPRLLTGALRNMTGLPDSRYVFPLGSWRLESSVDGNYVIATFATEDGFEVSFGVPLDACQGLGWALKNEAAGAREAAGTREEIARLN